MSGGRRTNLALTLLGLASAGLYVLLAIRYPLLPSLENPRGGWIGLDDPTGVGAAYHTTIYLGLTLLYILALRLLLPLSGNSRDTVAAPARLGGLIVSVVWLVCCGILLAVAPGGESHDIFDYIFRGRMMAEYGASPLAVAPNVFRAAPYYHYIAWHNHVDTYGPVWETASLTMAVATRTALQAAGLWATTSASCPQSQYSCRMLIGYLTSYRLLAIVLTGSSAWLIASMVRRNRPGLALSAMAAWLWNPLLIVSTAIGAHNDAVMITLLLFMLWLLQRRIWLVALLALAVAAHVKVTALIVAPAVGLWLVRRCGLRRAAALVLTAGMIGVLLSKLLYAPFGGWETLPRMLGERSLFLANSPWRVLHYHLNVTLGWPVETVRPLTVQLPTALFAASAVLASLWMLDFRPARWKAVPVPDWSDDRMLWRTAAAVSLLYLLVGSFWFQPWYVLWVLAPGALMPDSLLTRRLLPWLGFGALVANVIGGAAPALIPADWPKIGKYALTVASIWVPMLIAGVWFLSRRRSGVSEGAAGCSIEVKASS